MERIRAATRAMLLVVCTAGYYAFLRGTAALLELRGGAGGSGQAAAVWRTRVFRSWARFVRRLLGMRVDVRGTPPAAPFFLVSNHLGYMDVIVIAAELPAVFVARADVNGWPAVGALCRLVDTLFIDRARKRDIPRVIGEMERVFRSGRGIVIFPEGTSTRGAEVQPFRPSLLEPAARMGRPVCYASLSYRTPPGCAPAHESVCWWGDMGFSRHLRALLGLPHFGATLVFGDRPVLESDRKLLATRLRDAVSRQFQPVVG